MDYLLVPHIYSDSAQQGRRFQGPFRPLPAQPQGLDHRQRPPGMVDLPPCTFALVSLEISCIGLSIGMTDAVSLIADHIAGLTPGLL